MDEAWADLALECPNLRVLSVNQSGMSVETMNKVLKTCTKLQHLMVKGCFRDGTLDSVSLPRKVKVYY